MTAIDIDEVAIENARENIEKNDTGDTVIVRKGTEDAIGDEIFDLIVANIDRKTLIQIVPKLIHHTKTGENQTTAGFGMT